jgi:RNA polymerase sigma factor (sigma-70 family)
MKEAQALLRQYVEEASEPAFREIVDRYINFVYGTARRCVGGDAHLAQDVTQTVFTHLAQRAHTLTGKVMLGGWLHRDTYHVAATVMRTERRRQLRERQAMETNSLEDHTQANLANLRPVLDEEIDRLGNEDRTAILLRFFEQLDFRSVGEVMGSSENAAQKRVSRALEELRGRLQRRGLVLSAGGLGVALTTEAMAVAPIGMAATAAGAALASSPGTAGTAAVGLKLFATAKLSTVLATSLVLAGIATPWLLHRQGQAEIALANERLRAQSAQLARLLDDIESLSNALASRDHRPAVASAPLRELLRLRGEVGRLRSQEREMTTKLVSGSTNDDLVSREAFWAQRVGQVKQWLAANPSEAIPELRLLDERDWLDCMNTFPLDSADEYSKALSAVRGRAEEKVIDGLASAFRKYTHDNNGQSPNDLSQLSSYLDPSLDNSILLRYEIVPSTQLVSELQGHGDLVITQKAPVNEALDTRSVSGLTSGGGADSRVTNRWTVSR